MIEGIGDGVPLSPLRLQNAAEQIAERLVTAIALGEFVPGQPAPQGSPLGWAMGETAIWLHGEVGPDALRTYRPRVR